jgi:hypothetical protein
MSDKPSFFNKELKVKGYAFYLNEHKRAYVPTKKEDFEKFIDTLFAILEVKTEEQTKNYELLKSFPFLLPKNRFDHGLMLDVPFKFSRTELDSMPDGWRQNFGLKITEEINEALLKIDEEMPYKYMITDIKEKYGSLRWYDNGATEEVFDIIEKYTNISEKVCTICGKRGKIDNNVFWLEPLCQNHRKDRTWKK